MPLLSTTASNCYVMMFSYYLLILLLTYDTRASGTVHMAVNKRTRQVVAIKMMDLNHQPKKELIVAEIDILKQNRHENIVNFVDCYFLGHELWVVMEVSEKSVAYPIYLWRSYSSIDLPKPFYHQFIFSCHFCLSSVVTFDLTSNLCPVAFVESLLRSFSRDKKINS